MGKLIFTGLFGGIRLLTCVDVIVIGVITKQIFSFTIDK